VSSLSSVARQSRIASLLALAVTCLPFLSACVSSTPAVRGDPRDKVVALYGQPNARQSNANIEVWQYCTPRKEGDSLDNLHLVWLMDGIVVRESRHTYDLDRCQRLYVVDLGSPPQPS